MRLKLFAFSVVACLLVLPCQTDADVVPPPTSLIQLIANPTKYDNKVVSVIGFLRLGLESETLFVTQEDYSYSIEPNGVSIAPSSEMVKQASKFHGKYVHLVGTFKAASSPYEGSGKITDIKICDVWHVRHRNESGGPAN